mmetsp:Transcript_14312/g.32412  ORF Transcript_14312/g.32412 Transcript_14312/m.32412 type:complete len:102 (+) Transcript_14312:733-1038(+)
MRLCWSRGRERHIAGPDSARGVRRLEEEDEEASSRDRKSGAGEDRGHSSRALSNMMSAIHDEPHQVGDDTEDDREENWAGSVVNSGRGRFRLISRVTVRLK